MNSDGEKMPPDAPEPRLTVVANSLPTNSPSSRTIVIELFCRIAWIVA